jgi:lipoprotein-anchoring transpeptidase ErfK/SrfK
MRARLVAALLTATALTVGGAAGAGATSTPTDPTTSTTVADGSTTTTTVAPDDQNVDGTAPPAAPIGQPGTASGAAARTGNTIQVGDTVPPPPPEEILPADSGVGRRVVYSNSAMRVWAVEEDGTVVKTHRVSGLSGIPGPGTYTVWSRSLYTYSVNNPSIRWMYMVRFAWTPRGGNIGFHEIPTKCDSSGCHKMQTEEQLGESLSGGCVRQSTPDAIWMWEWAQLGTKVVVLP